MLNDVLADRRLLLVHAHPDDESSQSAATMARYVAEGAQVTLVTCTLGELGEILVPDWAHFTPGELGGHRQGEIAVALADQTRSTPPSGVRRTPRSARESGMRSRVMKARRAR